MKQLVVILASAAVLAASCWDLKELSKMGEAELEGNVILSFKDATSCQPLEGVGVTIGAATLTSDKHGYVTIPLPEDTMELHAPMRVEKSRYIPLKTTFDVEANTVQSTRFLLSPQLSMKNVRFVLSWADRPADLDLHLTGPGFHVSYRNKRNVTGKAKLDRDARQGYGPETITLREAREGERYELFVDKFGGEGELDGSVKVAVYRNNQLDREIRLPSTAMGAVRVLAIDNGEFVYENRPLRSVPR